LYSTFYPPQGLDPALRILRIQENALLLDLVFPLLLLGCMAFKHVTNLGGDYLEHLFGGNFFFCICWFA
jgi:hypothetical protein